MSEQFNIDLFLKEKILIAKNQAQKMGLSLEDSEDIAQEIAAEFFIKFNNNKVDICKNIDGYWHVLENWRILDKINRNSRREKLFTQIGEENDMDSLPLERSKTLFKQKVGTLREAVLNLKNDKCFSSKFFQRDVSILLLSLKGKDIEEIKKQTKIKKRETIYVAKNRMINKLKKSLKQIQKTNGI